MAMTLAHRAEPQPHSDTELTTRVPAVERSIALLRLIAAADAPQTLAELSDALGVARSTTHSLLATLMQQQFVEKEPRHKTYRLGIGVFELGNAYLRQISLVPIFTEVAQQLVAICHETVKLAVREGREVIYLGKQEGLYSVQLVARVGSRMPAHATAVGKVLLGDLSDEALRILYSGYSFAQRTPKTIGTIDALVEEITIVRQRGHAYDLEENIIGAQCVAAPVRDHTGAVVAAISIGVPNDRLDNARFAILTAATTAAAATIAARLGWNG